jgi:hypothetical protein
VTDPWIGRGCFSGSGGAGPPAALERKPFGSESEAEARAEQERQQAELRAREERFRTLLGRWRLARDTRAYVLEARGLLEAAELRGPHPESPLVIGELPKPFDIDALLAPVAARPGSG